MKLHEKGLIHGVQIRVSHPSFTPTIDIKSLPSLLSRFPKSCCIFIHIGSESVGVDLGENFDEELVFSKHNQGRNWHIWNHETVLWGLRVAEAFKEQIPHSPECVIHPGYGTSPNDRKSENKIIEILRLVDNGRHIALENVPPIVDKKLYGPNSPEAQRWNGEKYWGFGGTPYDMLYLLIQLGLPWRCLIDISHAIVLVNQANWSDNPLLSKCKERKKTLNAYLQCLHIPVCHFSGIQKSLIDIHTNLAESPIYAIAEIFRKMEAVCLEIPFRPETAEQIIRKFRTDYGTTLKSCLET